MARAAKLKVFRTPAGFDDAYVAAPSRKAALKAWGSDADLFARGIAEQITDAALTEAPLAHPGEVIRVRRSAPAETTRNAPPKATGKVEAAANPKPKARKPSRAALDRAEAALEAAEADRDAKLAAIEARRKELDREREAIEKVWRARKVKLDRTRIRARDDYDAALAQWDG